MGCADDYRKFVREQFINRFDKPETIEFNDNSILCTDFICESKIKFQGIVEINETNNYYYLKIKTGGEIIIPKSKIDNIENLMTELNRITSVNILP
jgi:hypothetical protein